MEAENNCFETQINGFGLRVKLTGQVLKVTLNSRNSGKKYETDLAYQAQSQSFKYTFQSMEQAFQHIKDEVTAKSEMIRIIPDGKLQIGTKVKQRIRYLSIEIQQVELLQVERLIQVVSFVKKDVDALNTNIDELKANLDEQKKNMLKIKQQLRGQIADLRKQLNEIIYLKSDAQVTDQKLVSLKQQMIQKLIQNKNQFNQLVTNLKAQMDNHLLRQSRSNEEKLNETNAKIQELKRQTWQLARNNELQLAKQTELERQVGQLGRNTEVQLARHTQMRDVHTALQSRIQEEAKKFKLAEVLLNYKFPKMMESRFVPLTVDPTFGQFQAGGYKMKNSDRIFQKVNDNNTRQIVSKEQLPRKGKYYFQVMFHYSSGQSPNYIYAWVGIITQNLRHNQTSYNNQQCSSYSLSHGNIYENGSSRTVGTTMYSAKGLVTVVIDADQRKISWYYDHQFQASTTISQTIMDKKIYAYVEAVYYGLILQLKS